MSIQEEKIKAYSLPTSSLSVGIYIQNWLLKVVQIYRERYLHGDKQENTVSIERLLLKGGSTYK